VTRICPVGTTAKFDVFNDIDLAVEYKFGRDELFEKLKDGPIKFGDGLIKNGTGVISIRWPFGINWVQVDLIVGEVNWLEWARYGPGPGESRVKGVVRNMFINSLLREMSDYYGGDYRCRYLIDWDVGLFKAEQKSTGSEARPWKTTSKILLTSEPSNAVNVIAGRITSRYAATFEDWVQIIRVSPTKLRVQAHKFPIELEQEGFDAETIKAVKEIFDESLD
jgi:hypothetical protein